MLQSLFNKVAGIAGLQLYHKETPTQVLSCESCEILKNSFFKRTPPLAASVSLKGVFKTLPSIFYRALLTENR